MKYINRYLNEESKDFNVLDYSNNIVNLIKSNDKSSSDKYLQLDKIEINNLDKLDITVFVKFKDYPNISTDEHFNKLPWEQLNTNMFGYSIDANTYIGKDTIIPEICIYILISRYPDYNEMKFRLVDIVFHELKHTNQVGINRKPVNIHPGDSKDRKHANTPIKYFHLPEEVEAMIYGMYNRSKLEGSNIDDLMYKYLTPYIKNGNLNIQEATKTMTTWIKHTLENYPDSNFSKSELTSHIIKNL